MFGREFKPKYKSILGTMVADNGVIIGKRFSKGNCDAVMESSGNALISSLIISAVLNYFDIIYSTIVAMVGMSMLFLIFLFRKTVLTKESRCKIYKLKRRLKVLFKCYTCHYHCKENLRGAIIDNNTIPDISIDNCPELKGD